MHRLTWVLAVASPRRQTAGSDRRDVRLWWDCLPFAYSPAVEKFWRDTGVWLGKHWKLVTAAVVAITVLLGIGLTQIEFATGQDSYLNPDSQIAIDNVEFQDNFGGETVILLFSAQDGSDISDLYVGANLAELRRLNVELAEVDNVFSVITPLTSLTYSDELIAGPGQTALISAATRDTAGAEARSRTSP